MASKALGERSCRGWLANGHLTPQARPRRAVPFVFPIRLPRSLRSRRQNPKSYQTKAAVSGGRNGAGAGYTRRQIRARQGARLSDRDPSAGASADHAAPARHGRRNSTPAASSPAIAARRWAGSTRRCGMPAALSKRTTFAFSPRSTKSSAPPRFGAVSSSTSFRTPNTTASLRCGTPRDRASTAAATR